MRRHLVVLVGWVAGCAHVRSSAYDPPEVWLPAGPVAWVDASADLLGAEVLRGFGAVAAEGGVPRAPGGVTVTLDRVEGTAGGEVLTWWSVTGPDGALLESLAGVTTPTSGDGAAFAVGAAVGHHLVAVRADVTRRVWVSGPLRSAGAAMRAGDTRSALAALDRVSEQPLDPRWLARVHHDEAVVWELDGEYTRAVHAERDAAALDPAHDRCVARLAAVEQTHRPLVSTDKGAPPEGW